jgi:hypothetical protein
VFVKVQPCAPTKSDLPPIRTLSVKVQFLACVLVITFLMVPLARSVSEPNLDVALKVTPVT